MAEIILPPEENEETPQVPELNIDKPTENSKVITIEFEAKKTNKVSTKDTNQQLYTTDTDAWFEFKETSLEGANGTYSVVFRNRHDGSIFQRTGDVVNGVAYYKIPHQEIRHAGAWRGQVVYTLENGNTTAREFGYDVKGHILDGKDVREIIVEDFETLMSQLRSMKDSAEVELANLVNTANQNETDRQVFFDDLVEDIDELQANYQELLDTGVLQTNINTKLEALEEEYAPRLTEVTAQLAQKPNTNEVRKKSEPIALNDFDGETLGIIRDGSGGTPINIESVPRDGSVTPLKTTFFNEERVNLFDKSSITTPGIVSNSNGRITTAGIAYLYGASDYMPVEGGEIYEVYHDGVSGNASYAWFSDRDVSNYISGGYISKLNRKITSPQTAKYLRVSVLLDDLDVAMVTKNELPEEYVSYESTLLFFQKQSHLKAISNSIYNEIKPYITDDLPDVEDEQPNRFEGLIWSVIGDSITQKTFRATKNYHDYVAEWLEMTVDNQGKSGTGYLNPSTNSIKIPDRLDSINPDADIITIMAGVNDRSRPLGEFGDTDKDTSLYGSMDYTFNKLIEMFPTKKIGIITPLPTSNAYGTDGNSLHLIANAVIETAHKYSLPVLDLYRESGLRPWNDVNNETYFSSNSSPNGDGLHPNAEGHLFISYKILEFIKTL